MKKNRNYIARMLSSDPSVSLMRNAVMVCVISAIFISIDTVVMWNLYLFGLIKSPFEIGTIVGLVGTLLSPLIPKAIQSFSGSDRYRESDEDINSSDEKEN